MSSRAIYLKYTNGFYTIVAGHQTIFCTTDHSLAWSEYRRQLNITSLPLAGGPTTGDQQMFFCIKDFVGKQIDHAGYFESEDEALDWLKSEYGLDDKFIEENFTVEEVII